MNVVGDVDGAGLVLVQPDLPKRVDNGWARSVSRGPSTVAEVLERGRLAMEAEDREEEYRRDPVAYVKGAPAAEAPAGPSAERTRTMKIATGEAESHESPPLDQAQSPATVAPTPRYPPGGQGGVADTGGMFASQAAAGEADVAAAMHSGMSADGDRRSHYQAALAPLGGSAGAQVDLPVVPDNALPPAQSFLYPWSGDEPTPAG